MKIIILNLFLVGCLLIGACNFNRDHISITTKDNGDYVNFTAIYPEHKTAKAQQYIETSFKEDRIFKLPSDAKKVEIRLVDGTHFNLKYEPGYLAIHFDRDKNSNESYQQMKKMIAGFGKAIN